MEGVTFESIRRTGWHRYNIPDPWLPHAEGNFKTPSGKCEFYAESIDPPMPEYHPAQFSEEELEYPLHLMTVKSPRNFLNSSHANVRRLRDAEGEPWLDIHPTDAFMRNLSNGDKVSVYNSRGEVIVRLKFSEKVRPGVVCMPQGFWTSLVEGGSTANALTDDRLTDMGGGGAIQEARVNVRKL